MSARLRGRRWLVWSLVGAGFVLFAGANAHLVYVAVASQPDCVSHSRSAGGEHDYRAAKSAC
jgi:hypothetical protein